VGRWSERLQQAIGGSTGGVPPTALRYTRQGDRHGHGGPPTGSHDRGSPPPGSDAGFGWNTNPELLSADCGRDRPYDPLIQPFGSHRARVSKLLALREPSESGLSGHRSTSPSTSPDRLARMGGCTTDLCATPCCSANSPSRFRPHQPHRRASPTAPCSSRPCSMRDWSATEPNSPGPSAAPGRG
jgi:hypothetical protein